MHTKDNRVGIFRNISIRNLLILFMADIVIVNYIYFSGGREASIDVKAGWVSYIAYLNWLTMIFIGSMTCRIKKRYIIFACLVMANEFIALLMGYAFLSADFYAHMHRPLIFTAAVVCIMGIDWSWALSRKDMQIFMRAMFVLGVISTLYATIFQYEILIGFLRGTTDDGWFFVSFFRQRNVYACYCYAFIIAGFYLWESEHRKIYILGILLFFLQIIVTDSRNSFFSTILFFMLYLLYKKRLSIPIMLSMLSLFAAVFLAAKMFDVKFDDFMEIFNHRGGGQVEDDSRFVMWKLGFEKLSECYAYITGLGDGSGSLFLASYVNVGSFHNVYMDILFDGGGYV